MSVLELRRRASEEAGRLLAARRKQLQEAESELIKREEAVNRCHEQLIAAQHRMFAAAVDGIEANRLLEFRSHLADLKNTEEELRKAFREQQDVVARAESEVDKAIEALRDANKQEQIIEKHRDAWNRKVQLEERQREQKVNDEMSALLYERHRRLIKA